MAHSIFLRYKRLMTIAILFGGMLLSPLSVSSVIASNSTLEVGSGTGYVQSGLETTITLTALDGSSTPIEGATVTLQILVSGGAEPSGTLYTEGGQETSASNATVYGTTNASGVLKIFWKVPSLDSDAPAEIHAIVHDGTDDFTMPVQTVTITPDVTSLDIYDVSIQETVYTDLPTEVTVSATKLLGGQYTGVQVQLTADAGSFIPASGNLDVGGRFTSQWNAPSSTGTVNITATFTLVDGVTVYQAFAQVNVTTPDLKNSSIVFEPSAVTGGEEVKITVSTAGEFATIPGVDVSFGQDGGSQLGVFSEKNLVTNSSGLANTTWIAPKVTSVETINITATMSYGGLTTTLSATITVSPILYMVEVSTNTTEVNKGESVEFVVHVEYNDTPIEGANVEMSFSEGTVESTIETTDVNGNATFVWTASFEPALITGSDVLIIFEAYDNRSGVVEQTKTIHVLPPELLFPVNVTLDKNPITVEEVATIEVKVMNYTGSEGFEGAVVRMTSIVGTFESSNQSDVVKTTDSAGTGTFVWRPTGLSDPQQPQNITIEVELSISDFNYLSSFSFNITIVPTAGVTESTGPSGSTDQSTLSSGSTDSGTFILIAGIGIAGIIGLVTVILRRR